uniref:Uncharacterized protein n=1 Tax=Rhizophagus irregularis (strain DAOM 181602 / DAOM 197198 / MUCL 43194) TaxID=747089 RepID=U9SP81_RHIID
MNHFTENVVYLAFVGEIALTVIVDVGDGLVVKSLSVQQNVNYPLISSYEAASECILLWLKNSQNHEINVPSTQDSIVGYENDYIINEESLTINNDTRSPVKRPFS